LIAHAEVVIIRASSKLAAISAVHEAMNSSRRPSFDGVLSFFGIACGFTWLLAAPLAHSWAEHTPPPPYAMAGAGLSAFGPLVAALAVSARQKVLGETFGRWRTAPKWILLALFAPMVIHVVATALAVALGESPVDWLHPPSAPERVAALVVFPIGEEFGWRGFAHPRLMERFGLVKGSLVLGALWGVWHLMYSITPDSGGFDPATFAMTMAELPLYTLLITWVFERANRSMAVAIAFHAGGHLDHFELVPFTHVRLHAMNLLVLGVLAAAAAHSLSKKDRLATAPV
jgi:membrane protease YdiL (CAAX protease family)